MTEREGLERWLDNHYTELRNNAELREAHQRALRAVAMRVALVGLVFLVLTFVLLSLLSSSPERLVGTDWAEFFSAITPVVLLGGAFVGFLCLMASLKFYFLSLGKAPLDNVPEGRGLIPTELIARLRKEYRNE